MKKLHSFFKAVAEKKFSGTGSLKLNSDFGDLTSACHDNLSHLNWGTLDLKSLVPLEFFDVMAEIFRIA